MALPAGQAEERVLGVPLRLREDLRCEGGDQWLLQAGRSGADARDVSGSPYCLETHLRKCYFNILFWVLELYIYTYICALCMLHILCMFWAANVDEVMHAVMLVMPTLDGESLQVKFHVNARDGHFSKFSLNFFREFFFSLGNFHLN